jgi:hypothetical protein
MLRFVEVALFLAPFAVVAAWRLLLPAPGPSLRLVAAVCALAALVAGTLLWLRARDAEAPMAAYVPAHIEDGHVVPSGEAPR